MHQDQPFSSRQHPRLPFATGATRVVHESPKRGDDTTTAGPRRTAIPTKFLVKARRPMAGTLHPSKGYQSDPSRQGTHYALGAQRELMTKSRSKTLFSRSEVARL